MKVAVGKKKKKLIIIIIIETNNKINLKEQVEETNVVGPYASRSNKILVQEA